MFLPTGETPNMQVPVIAGKAPSREKVISPAVVSDAGTPPRNFGTAMA
jgi:hypothetical protein